MCLIPQQMRSFLKSSVSRDSLCGTEDGGCVRVCVSVSVCECAIDTKRSVQQRQAIRPVSFFLSLSLSQESHMHKPLLVHVRQDGK